MTNQYQFRNKCWLAVFATAWLAIAAGKVCAQQNADRPKLRTLYVGTSDCVRCHEKGPAPTGIPYVCRCDELTRWKEDKHDDAYNVLLGDQAKRMGKLLYNNTNVTAKQECLACHGAYVEDPKERDATFHPEDGVSCIICHGPSGDWREKHSAGAVNDLTAWRKLSRKDREAHGMTDVWDPAKRTALCASCHIGNHEQGKVVTHAMYAAGHPPLPGFEVATFGDSMPRHWELLKEKTPVMLNILKPSPAETAFEQTRLVLVGGMAAFRETFALLADEADHALAAKEKWTDWAQFDCFACHHELETPSWRQHQPRFSKPGRPAMRAWPTAIVRLDLHLLGESEEPLDGLLRAVGKTTDVQPFGQPTQLAAAARAVTKWADTKCKSLDKLPIDSATLQKALQYLADLGQKASDYDAARQITWAFQSIYNESHQVPFEQRQAVLAKVRALQWKLPAGRERHIADELDDNLLYRNQFEPTLFQGDMRQLISGARGAAAKPRP